MSHDWSQFYKIVNIFLTNTFFWIFLASLERRSIIILRVKLYKNIFYYQSHRCQKYEYSNWFRTPLSGAENREVRIASDDLVSEGRKAEDKQKSKRQPPHPSFAQLLLVVLEDDEAKGESGQEASKMGGKADLNINVIILRFLKLFMIVYLRSIRLFRSVATIDTTADLERGYENQSNQS